MSTPLTSGTPWRVIVMFAIPLLIGNVVQQMYQIVDAIVVGQHLGVNALAAVGTTGGLLFLLMGFAWGMTSGFAIPTAQAFGAGNHADVRHSIVAGTILTALTSLLISVGGVLFARNLLVLLKTPDILIDDATTFAVISFAGMTATMFFNYLSAIIRAIGDSRTPLIFLVISCLVNIALVIFMVGNLGLGIAGAASATIAAQLLSVVLCTAYIVKYIPVLHVGRADIRGGVKALGRHLHLGLPMGFQASIIAIGTVAVQVRLNTLGATEVAAYTTGSRVDGLGTALLASLGLAVSTFTAQNYGAGLFDRIVIGVKQANRIAVVAGLLLGLIMVAAGSPIVRLFVGEGNGDVVAMAHQLLVITGVFYFALGVLFVTRGALQGLGYTLVPTISGIMELTMRVLVAIVLGGFLGYTGVVWANAAPWFGACAILIPAWLKARRKLLEVAGEAEVSSPITEPAECSSDECSAHA